MAMNLGSARLQHVNTSRPQLQHTTSKHSIAASDDYYSLSENSTGSNDDRQTVIRYKTPPSKKASADALGDDTTKPEKRLSTHHEVPSAPPSRDAEKGQIQGEGGPEKGKMQHQIQRRPVSSANPRNWRDSHVDATAPTPGLDDSPYIHFAIDQLTRDEEVSGNGRDSRDSRDVSSMSSRPTRSAKNYRSPRISGIDTSEHETSSSESKPDLGQGSSPIRASFRPDTPPDVPPAVPPKSASRPASRAITPVQQTHEWHSPAKPQEQSPRHILLPAHPQHNDYRYPELNFVPGCLRILPIAAFIFFCVILIVLLILSSTLAAQHDGLSGYDGVGTGRYFVFEYLPQLFAAVVLIWLSIIQTAIQRILPFVLLTKSNGYPVEDVFDDIPLYITNYLTPNMALFRQRDCLKYCSIIFWLELFTIPLASALYQTRFYPSVGNGAFIWTTVQPISFILIVLYLLLIVALVLVYTRLRRHSTGLKWDPVSLADFFVLLRRTSNLTSARHPKSPGHHSSRPVSLGYWESTSQPGTIFHGIGTANAPSNQALTEKTSEEIPERQGPLQASTFESWHSHHWTHNSSQPAFLRESRLIFYSLIALALLIAFLVVSYLRNQLVAGFLPLLPSATEQTSSFESFSPSNFLYSFIPALIGLFLPLFWAPIDTAFRYLQPFVSLSDAPSAGVSSESTLLLSYPSTLPLFVSFRALANGHLRVAWFSLLGLLSWSIPIIAGGLFTAQYITSPGIPGTGPDAGAILMRPDDSALYALTVFLILYVFSWLLLFPGGMKRTITSPTGMAVDVRYLGGLRDVVSSAALSVDVWREPRSRADLVGRLVASDNFTGRGWRMEGGRIMRA